MTAIKKWLNPSTFEDLKSCVEMTHCLVWSVGGTRQKRTVI